MSGGGQQPRTVEPYKSASNRSGNQEKKIWMDWPHTPQAPNEHNETVTFVEPPRTQKGWTPQTDLEKNHRSGNSGCWVVMETAEEDQSKTVLDGGVLLQPYVLEGIKRLSQIYCQCFDLKSGIDQYVKKFTYINNRKVLQADTKTMEYFKYTRSSYFLRYAVVK
ncbi:hypothetical protein ACF0H5_018056 [Mactra antiquata]